MWQPGEPKHTIEWEEGSLLAIPLNAWHQEFNSSGTEPCRMLFGTNMAQVINLYHNLEFVFNNDFCFRDRYSFAMQDYFSGNGKHWNLRLYETNFIADIRKLNLDRTNEFHQHFNTGKGDYKMLAFRGSGLRYGSGRNYNPALTAQDKDPYSKYGFKISYEREDSAIREDYYKELEKNNVPHRLNPVEQSAGGEH